MKILDFRSLRQSPTVPPSSSRRAHNIELIASVSFERISSRWRAGQVYAVVGIGSMLVLGGMPVLYAMRAAEATSLSEHLQPIRYVDLAQNYLSDAGTPASRADALTDFRPALPKAAGNTPNGGANLLPDALPKKIERRQKPFP